MERGSREPMRDPVYENEELIDYDTYIEPFIGWRAWNIILVGDNVRLTSITHQKTWPPGEEMRAECVPTMWNRGADRIRHSAPNKNCNCGIHAVLTMEDALQWHAFATPEKMRCVGEAKLWGIVYRFTRGFLAEYAYPSKIWVPHETPHDFPLEPRECVRELRRTYKGVEVKLL